MSTNSQPSSSSAASASSGPSSSGPSKKEPQRTTKETHPNLPPGLILDAEGKVCKVCNSWQDWGKMRIKKKSAELGQAGENAQTGTMSKTGKMGQTRMGGMGGFGAMAGFATSSKSPSSNGPNESDSSSTTSVTTTTTTTATTSNTRDRGECPADTAALGRSTWTFLHTTAAYYPLKAPPSIQTQMHNLLSSLSILYPCTPCADDFQDKVKASPPDLSGREGLSKWLCERHNEVNEKLGKERFECDWSTLNRRWKDGPDDGSCD